MPDDLPLFAAHSGTRRVRRSGLVSIRRSDTGPYDRIGPLRVDPPGEIIASCARTLAELDLACLVAAALRTGSCTVDDLAQVARQPRSGVRVLRSVLGRTDHRHDSVWEVMLAELHHAVGVAVEPQKVVETAAGDFVAQGDLWLVGTRRLHEYDGAHHGQSRQRRNDQRREGRILRAGWTRRGHVSDDLLYGAAQVLADAQHALGVAEDRAPIRAWHDRLRRSCSLPLAPQRSPGGWVSDPIDASAIHWSLGEVQPRSGTPPSDQSVRISPASWLSRTRSYPIPEARLAKSNSRPTTSAAT